LAQLDVGWIEREEHFGDFRRRSSRTPHEECVKRRALPLRTRPLRAALAVGAAVEGLRDGAPLMCAIEVHTIREFLQFI
jgi:hypothetical protein